jgi:hypothetical protein
MGTARSAVSEVFLKNVAFKDFRTFGEFGVEIVPAPGLTLLVGTNGLGKSNFFDGLEWAITGEVRRLKPYMRAGDEAKVLTRRGARAGSHSVRLAFTGDQAITRGPRDKPASSVIVQLLKRERWTADIEDMGTYLAFTHFLGQAAQRRFTSREPGEQWESLKGPSGIDRLDEVRNGLRGRATQYAFGRRLRDQAGAIKEVQRQLTEWQSWCVRFARLRDAADAAGGLPDEEFHRRLNELNDAIAQLVDSTGRRANQPFGDQLAAALAALQRATRIVQVRRIALEQLGDVPARFAIESAAADPDAPALAAAREAVRVEREKLQAGRAFA